MLTKLAGIILALVAAVLALSGLALTVGGVLLLLEGGSAYYAPAGLALLATAWLLFRRRATAVVVFGTFALVSTAWALWEVGLDGWALMPRLAAIGVFLVILGALVPHLRRGGSRLGGDWLWLAGPAVALAGVTVAVLATPSRYPPLAAAPPATAWQQVSDPVRDARNHFSPAAQITPANVARLKVAWRYHTGDHVNPPDFGGLETTPVQVGDRLYVCTPHSRVIALEAATGRELWHYDPRPVAAPGSFALCRGVVHYTAAAYGDGRCAERIAYGTRDFRLIALDALDGRPCSGFGEGGIVALNRGFPAMPSGAVTMTSAPTIMNDLLIVGHFVMDNQRTDAPPGVVRAYDARTGAFRWAWDIGRPGVTSEPAAGQTYSLGRPNSWAGFTPDPASGLVFVPTGNPGGDYFSAARTPDMLQFGSSIVALDAATGHPRWSFQTVHRDTWDYDVPSAPALIDFPTAQGRVPALVQATKTGQIFILRRSDGQPLVPVVERPVSNRGAPGEILSPTQPFSTMPDMGGPMLREADAWGITPIDQMLCRLQFRRSGYAGRFTPNATRPTLIYPGIAGGTDWGGVAVDEARDLLIVNSTRVATRARLLPRTGTVIAQGDPGQDLPLVAPFPQKGTPYGVSAAPWLSPLRVPCQRPPWGLLTAIDLRTRQVRWTRVLGDASQSGPLGWRLGLPLPVGTPNKGGSLVTAGGLTFVGASTDAKFRAFETATGKLLWKARLPGGGQAVPASYTVGGRQFVVIAAGGHNVLGSPASDALVAFSLPAAEVRR